jgi:hypothetical protein
MAKLNIRQHERVHGHPHRWHVFLHGRDEPVPVELSPEERAKLDFSDEEIHTLVPEALQKHFDDTDYDYETPGNEYRDTDWDAPVRLMQTHFIA